MKWLWKTSVGFGILFLVILAALPTILSSNWGKEQLISYISASSGGSVKIKSIDLNWFGKQKIEDLTISVPDYHLDVASISAPKGLASFLFRGLSFSEVIVDSPQCKISQVSRGGGSGAAGALVAHLVIKNGSCSIHNKESRITFEPIGIDMQLDRSEKKVKIGLDTKTDYNGKEGRIAFQGAYAHSATFPIFNAQAQVANLPLVGLDEVCQLLHLYDHPLLSQSFGDMANIELNLDSMSNLIEAKIESQSLNLHLDTRKETPLQFDWTVNPSLLNLFNLKIDSPFKLNGSIEQLSLPSLQDFIEASIEMKVMVANLKYEQLVFDKVQVNLSSHNIKEKLKLASDLKFTSPHLSGNLSVSGFVEHLNQYNLTLGSSELYFLEPLTQIKRQVNQLKLRLHDNLAEGEFGLKNHNGASLLGNQCMAKLSSSYGQSGLSAFDLNIHSDVMKGNMQGRLDLNKHSLQLTKDAFIDYKLNPVVFEKAADQIPFAINMKKETMISVILEKSSSINKVNGKLISEDFTVLLNDPPQDYEFHNLDTQFEFLRDTNQLVLDASANIAPEGKLKLKYGQTLGQDDLTLRINAQDIPTNLFSPWLGQSLSLGSLIGTKVSFDTSINHAITFDISSDLLKMKGGLNKNGVTSPIIAKLTLTPETYRTLNASEKTPFELAQNATLNLKLSKYSVDPKVGFDSSDFKGQFTLSNFYAKRGNLEANVKSLRLDAKKKKNEAATATLSTSILSKGNEAQVDGSLLLRSINTKLPFSQMLSTMLIDTNISVSKLPTSILEALTQPFGEFPFTPLLGDKLNSEVSINMAPEKKDLKLTIDSTQADLFLEGIMAKRKFFLTKPIRGSFKMSDKLSHLMFDNFGFAIAKSRVPITLDVSDKKFAFPVKAHPLKETNIGMMILDLGQLKAVNSGTLKGINSIFKVQGSNTMQLWFAPYYMSMHKGVLNIERTEVLVDGNYHICMWGTIDFVKRYVKLTVGLTEQSLKKALGITGLPESYVLKVPLKGPFGDVKLQTGEVATKLALLIGGASSAPNSLFGGVVNVLNAVANDQSNIPKPKRPYPWEGQTSLKMDPIELKLSDPKEKELVETDISKPMHKFGEYLPTRSE